MSKSTSQRRGREPSSGMNVTGPWVTLCYGGPEEQGRLGKGWSVAVGALESLQRGAWGCVPVQ